MSYVKIKHKKIIYNLLLCFMTICKCPIPDCPYLTDYMACFDTNLCYLQALRDESISIHVYLICMIADIASLFVQIMAQRAKYGPLQGYMTMMMFYINIYYITKKKYRFSLA